MSYRRLPQKSVHVAGAAAILVALGGLLGFRLAAPTSPGTATGPTPPAAAAPTVPPASVPAPRLSPTGTLPVPCWSCGESRQWPVRFRSDLDLLAPLGTGSGNAALWFKDFTKPDGTRYAEAVAAMARRIDGPNDVGKILPPDDPLLLEAEPWCDQATMRFYPDIYPIEGFLTKVPNLLLPLTFARSWVARGESADPPDRAATDFRRAIRLGRLLRQEDATVISDLVGLACIRVGVEGLYGLAVKQGDSRLALAAAIVLGEVAPQKLVTSERLTRTDLSTYSRSGPAGELTLNLPDRKLDDIIEAALTDPDRRFRAEAIAELNVVRFLGTPSQQEKSRAVLDRLAADADPIIATAAAWSRDTQLTREQLADALQPLK